MAGNLKSAANGRRTKVTARRGTRSRDRLDELRAQWDASGRSGDFDFAEFISGVTIVDQLIEREFKRFVTTRFGMSPGDVRILLALRRAPGQSLRPTDLFKQLLVTSGAITKQLDRLEARECVQRVFNSESKRGRLITLTDKGREITDSTDGGAQAAPIMRSVFYDLSAAQRTEALKMLHLLVRGIQDRTRDDPID